MESTPGEEICEGCVGWRYVANKTNANRPPGFFEPEEEY